MGKERDEGWSLQNPNLGKNTTEKCFIRNLIDRNKNHHFRDLSSIFCVRSRGLHRGCVVAPSPELSEAGATITVTPHP